MAPQRYTGQTRFLQDAPLPVWLLAVAAAGVVAWRLSREARRLWLIGVAMVAAVVLSIMRTAGAVQVYRLGYTWAPPMVVAVAAVWVLWLALARHPAARRVLTTAALAGSVVAGVLAVSGATQGTQHADDVDVADTLTAPLLERYAGIDEPLVLDEVPNLALPWYTRGIALQLERHRVPVEIDPHIGYTFARSQVHHGGRTTAHLLVATLEDVEPLLEEREVHLVARWLAVPQEEHERLTRELEEIEDQLDDGEISQDEYNRRLTTIGREMSGDRTGTTANDVAVFIDERPRDADAN